MRSSRSGWHTQSTASRAACPGGPRSPDSFGACCAVSAGMPAAPGATPPRRCAHTAPGRSPSLGRPRDASRAVWPPSADGGHCQARRHRGHLELQPARASQRSVAAPPPAAPADSRMASARAALAPYYPPPHARCVRPRTRAISLTFFCGSRLAIARRFPGGNGSYLLPFLISQPCLIRFEEGIALQI